MISKHGELFEFNVFSSTLGYSRLHNFVYSKTKTREYVQRCLMTTFKFMAGVPKCMLTDNMRAVVDIIANKRKVNTEFNQFAKDMALQLNYVRLILLKLKVKMKQLINL